MKNPVCFLLSLCIVLGLFACSTEEINAVVISEEAVVLQGYTIEDYVDYLFELGDTYITDAYANEDGDLIIEVNGDQRDALMDYYDSLYESYLEQFLKQDENYAFDGSDDYASFALYCDEDTSYTYLLKALVYIGYAYTMNHALYDGSEANTSISVMNCHTNQTILSIDSFIDMDISFNEADFVVSNYTDEDKEPIYTNEAGEDVYLIHINYLYFVDLEDDADDYATDLLSYGEEYISDAYAEDDDLYIEATDNQIANLLALRDENFQENVDGFLALSTNYSFEGSEDYSSFTVYCDENIDTQDLYDLVIAAAYNYSFNHALYAKTYNDTTVRIAHYETGEIVLEGSFLFDSLTVDSLIWE